MRYQAFELHGHTHHSDGKMSPAQLCKEAVAQMLSGIAITDHNTAAAHLEEIGLQDIAVIQGMEWTTFWGHLLVIGSCHEGRWLTASPDNMGHLLAELNSEGMAIGIAHPRDIAGVLRTGANWEYPMPTWKDVHYMEIFSNFSPHLAYINKLAYEKWTVLLNSGYRLATTSGRDWHVPHSPGQHAAVTYLGIDGAISTATVVDALRSGRSYVTLGPCMNFAIRNMGTVYSIGDTIENGQYYLTFESFCNERHKLWKEFALEISEYRLVHNGVISLASNKPIQSEVIRLSKGWARAELYGVAKWLQEPQLLAFTSPIYVL